MVRKPAPFQGIPSYTTMDRIKKVVQVSLCVYLYKEKVDRRVCAAKAILNFYDGVLMLFLQAGKVH